MKNMHNRSVVWLVATFSLPWGAVALGQTRQAEWITLSGRVVASGGGPISDASVVLTPGGEEGRATAMWTGRDGRFVFGARVNRKYTLSLEARGFRGRSMPVKTSAAGRTVDVGEIRMEKSTSNAASDPTKAGLTDDLLRKLRADLGEEDCVRQSGVRLEQMIRVTWLSLSRAGGEAALVEGLGSRFAGADNRPFELYVHLGEDWRGLLYTSGERVHTLPETTNGFADLERWQHDSAFASVRYLYQYDGREYKAARCNVVEFGDASGATYPQPRYLPCGWDWKQ